MQPPMIGSWRVQVRAVRPFTIHGDVYYDLHVVRTDDASAGEHVLSIKVPQHAVPAAPEPGQQLDLTFLMGQVTAAKVVG